MTDPPTDDTEDREPDACDPTDSKSHTPRHGHTPHRRRASRQRTLRRALNGRRRSCRIRP
eukprot:scaffold2123_cov111-Isochrysis_galbana.AAC.9